VWVVAGILLGIVVLSALVGFHAGPLAHVVSVVAGVLAAAWLVVMLVLGESRPLLFVLLGADLSISSLLGYGAWRAVVIDRGLSASGHRGTKPLEGMMGTALSDLMPGGLVRVRGEDWSAVSLNGAVRAGTPVQVIEAGGVRLGVWGEQPHTGAGEPGDHGGIPEHVERADPDEVQQDGGA
jgi:membrane-bound ClpP family serine protease